MQLAGLFKEISTGGDDGMPKQSGPRAEQLRRLPDAGAIRAAIGRDAADPALDRPAVCAAGFSLAGNRLSRALRPRIAQMSRVTAGRRVRHAHQ